MVPALPTAAAPAPAPATQLSPAPRRVQPPRWLDLRLALGVALVLLAVVLGARVFTSAQRTEPALAVSHDLAAGTVLRSEDLTVVDVRVPADRYLRDRDAAVGKALTRPVAAGELLPAAAVRAAPSLTTLSVPLTGGSAPQLRPGQRIELWLSTPTCSSTVLLSDVPVQQVSAGNVALGGTGQDVVISVSADLAQRVMSALAIEKAVLRAGILTGPAGPAAAAGLAPLTGCLPVSR